jgi:hypothetical protein
LIGLISWPESQMKWKKRGRPNVYTQTVMLRCFVVRMWLRLDSNRALHDFLAKDHYPYNRKVLKACGLIHLPDRRTFDRRLKTISQADVQDNQIYPTITSSLPKALRYATGDSGYDDHKLYNLSTERGFELVCAISEMHNNTPSDRLQLIEFYESELGQIIYSWRSISVEPLIEHIKDIFKIDPLPIRGYQRAAGLVLLSVLLYQIIVYYNCNMHKEHPKAIKHMLGS